jgi:hypothetical protein
MLIALVLLGIPADAVPVTGAEWDNPTAPGHHLSHLEIKKFL